MDTLRARRDHRVLLRVDVAGGRFPEGVGVAVDVLRAVDRQATITEALGSYLNVLIVPDHDEAGFAFGSRVGALLPLARAKVPETPKDDARDVLTRYGADWFTTPA
jgi:hypothetical protein